MEDLGGEKQYLIPRSLWLLAGDLLVQTSKGRAPHYHSRQERAECGLDDGGGSRNAKKRGSYIFGGRAPAEGLTVDGGRPRMTLRFGTGLFVPHFVQATSPHISSKALMVESSRGPPFLSQPTCYTSSI